MSRNVGGDDLDDSADGVWEASEKLTPQQALTMYTTGAAHVAIMSGEVGTLWREHTPTLLCSIEPRRPWSDKAAKGGLNVRCWVNALGAVCKGDDKL